MVIVKVNTNDHRESELDIVHWLKICALGARSVTYMEETMILLLLDALYGLSKASGTFSIMK